MSKSELCRLCANLADHTNAQNLFKRKHQKMLRQIEELTGLLLKNTKDLPQFICKICQEQTLQAHEFRDRCIQAQKHFSTAEYRNQITAPPIEQVVVQEIKPIKEELDVEEGEALLKDDATHSHDDENSSSDSFNPLAENDSGDDQHNSSVEMLAMEPEKNLFAENVNKKPTVNHHKRNELKTHKKLQKSSELQKKPKRVRKKSVYPTKKDFVCEQCGNSFSLKTNFAIHMLRHTGNRPHQCELCPERYYTKAILARHMLTHTGEKPYPCRYCDSRFVDYSSRVRHERNHTNERPYSCNECGKSFTQSPFLKNHMLTHTGVRAFDCKMCNAQFKRKTHLVTHYRSLMHKQNEEKHQLLESQPSVIPECNISQK